VDALGLCEKLARAAMLLILVGRDFDHGLGGHAAVGSVRGDPPAHLSQGRTAVDHRVQAAPCPPRDAREGAAGAPVAPVLDDLDAVLEMRRVVRSDALLLRLSDERFDDDDLRNGRRRWCDPAAEAVRIDTTAKSARHAFASAAAAAGINDVLTAAEMGHSLTAHRDGYVKPLSRYAAAPFSGAEVAPVEVGTARFELATPCSQSRCATRLRHVPWRQCT
jgi:hypothetical protein